MSNKQLLIDAFSKNKKQLLILVCLFMLVVVAGLTCAFTLRKEITLKVNPNTGNAQEIRTQRVMAKYYDDLQTILAENDIPVSTEDYTYSVALDDRANSYDSVDIVTKVKGQIVVDGQTQDFSSGDTTVGEMLKNSDIQLGAADIVEPSADTPLTTEIQTITVHRVTEESVISQREIPFTSSTVKNHALGIGVRQTAIAGENGIEEVTEMVTTVDGAESGRREVGKQTIKEPVNEVIEVGETIEDLLPGRGFGNGGTITDSHFVANCSAYSDVNHVGHGASGRALREGYTIAADPSVYPYGTKIYIPYFNSTFEVVDCGTSIKGNKLDIYFDSYDDTCAFGRKQLDAYVVE